MSPSFSICDITPENVERETVFCIKNVKSPGFQHKKKWFIKRYQKGLRIHILKGFDGKMAGFIEYLPGNVAWRPVNAESYMFIHCLFVYPKKYKNQGYGSALVREAEAVAGKAGYSGLCTLSSKGAWMSNSDLFMKLGFNSIAKRGRFELLCKKWNAETPDPEIRNWELQQSRYQGWHLVYADQCPWHDKAVEALWNTAQDYGIDLQLTRLESAAEAQQAPSGFGVFSLLRDGKLLEDHYLSATRFKNILKQELKTNS
ncbi:MAG: GNAT family N-acetyltransferase [Flavobacteriaceae bacterium]|nr:GNAT family N-acetyltransferase [Eudoraea sp.]NNJ38881.1 GNAT family N-acetyltransferase [Flavobacteriaceae bacterium]